MILPFQKLVLMVFVVATCQVMVSSSSSGNKRKEVMQALESLPLQAQDAHYAYLKKVYQTEHDYIDEVRTSRIEAAKRQAESSSSRKKST